MTDAWTINATAWVVAACAFLVFVWWVLNLRDKVRYYLKPIDQAVKQMSEFYTKEDPAETAKRWKDMPVDELAREIKTIRQFNSWAKDIAASLEGLKASVPFLDCRRR
jgi:hypothetical protein